MLFFIYAVIGMQVSCHLVTSCPSLCCVFLSLVLSSSWPPSCVCPPGVLSSRVPVRSHCLSLLLLPVAFASLCLSSLCLSVCLVYKSFVSLIMKGRRFYLILSGQLASNFDYPREQSLPPINADVISCVL